MASDAALSVSRANSLRLALIAASSGFGQSALLALVPIVTERTGLASPQIGAVAFLGALVFLVAAPLWGHHGAAWRIRPFFAGLACLMVTGQCLFAGALYVGVPAAALGLLLVSRLFYSVGAAGVMPHAQAVIVQRSAAERRPAALANLSAGLNVGRIAGSLVTLGAGAGIIVPILMMVASPLLLLCAPNLAGAPAIGKKGEISSWRANLRRVLPLLAVGFALTFGFGQIQLVLGLFLQHRFGLDAIAAAGLGGATYAAVAVAMIATQILLVPRLAFKLGRNMRWGVAGFALGCLAIILAPVPWLVPAGAVLAGIGLAVATPAYTACLAQRVAAHRQAGAAGWLASTHAAGQGLGALCGGAAFALSPDLPFVMAVGIAAVTCLALLGLDDRVQDEVSRDEASRNHGVAP
ncbi:MFS transporter [Labrys sp. KNU-23]|uniref:MFS transporter n=1 Tax=Labrys sp. KNU-23 TaxID=2789216 RepID=UPI0011EC3EB0|nr:MFS transporter [Labrys sp. KNU-23]QEN86141.1 MFS transporter [Labrys sp. KNU-23]